VERYYPDVIGFSTMTWAASKFAKLSAIIRERLPNSHIVCGGVHATLGVNRLMAKYPQIDYTIIGEGEISMVELVKKLENGGEIRTVPGIYYRENGILKQGAPRRIISDLDALPFPALDLVKMEWYGHFGGFQFPKLAAMVSSRGCPFACTFCTCSKFAGRRWRSRSPENVVDEIEERIAEGYRTIFFVDDCFTVSKKRVEAISKLIRKRRVEVDWLCEGRVDQIDYQMTRNMIMSGCRLLYLGMESANQRTLNTLNKRITPQMSIQAAKTARRAGMEAILGTFILGAPGETVKEIQNTIDFTLKLDIDFPQLNILIAVPGTDLWNQLVAEGHIDDDALWEKEVLVTDVYPNSVPTNELREMIVKGSQKFAFRKEYIMKQVLQTLKSRFRLRILLRSMKHRQEIKAYIKEQFPTRSN
jgi:anaerobic magnesium-protoporphyrin IX monomethyl ester cyclase